MGCDRSIQFFKLCRNQHDFPGFLPRSHRSPALVSTKLTPPSCSVPCILLASWFPELKMILFTLLQHIKHQIDQKVLISLLYTTKCVTHYSYCCPFFWYYFIYIDCFWLTNCFRGTQSATRCVVIAYHSSSFVVRGDWSKFSGNFSTIPSNNLTIITSHLLEKKQYFIPQNMSYSPIWLVPKRHCTMATLILMMFLSFSEVVNLLEYYFCSVCKIWGIPF